MNRCSPPAGKPSTYTDARLLTAITNQIGEKIEFTHYLMGNVTQQVTKDAGGTIRRTQTRAYDELARLLRLIGAATQTTIFGYDNDSNLTSVTDALGKQTSFGFDALNRLTTATNPLMGVRTTVYDGQDNVTSESDERNIATTYVLNGFGEIIQEASPDGGTIVYVRDAAGNVTQKTDARGQVSTSSYDALNRVTATSFTGAPTFSITYGYDATAGGNYGVGRLTSVTDVSGQTALKYDHRGNIVAEERNIGGVLYTTSYAYDLADNLVAMTYPSGRIVTYTRDALGRLTRNLSGGPSETFTYGTTDNRLQSATVTGQPRLLASPRCVFQGPGKVRGVSLRRDRVAGSLRRPWGRLAARPRGFRDARRP